MEKKRFIILFSIAILAFLSIGCGKQTQSDTPKIDISSVVREAFVTDKGYTGELTKYMTQDVFTKTNIYNTYSTNDPQFKKPLNVDFALREVSQKNASNKVQVNMVYSVEIKDADNQIVGGSREIPISFTVETKPNGWYIVDKQEKP